MWKTGSIATATTTTVQVFEYGPSRPTWARNPEKYKYQVRLMYRGDEDESDKGKEGVEAVQHDTAQDTVSSAGRRAC